MPTTPINGAVKAIRNYRPDIDGLRGIAVLAVIAFHIDKSLAPGGFVGVDIFFVISGYLISQHILSDIGGGRFSIVEFYRRRIKRIAPAALVVIAITLIATQFLLRPEDAENTASSALWSLLSLANIYFWLYQDTSYFAAASSETPLLHLWSLGVEEQFYVIWPLLLAAVYKKTRNRGFFIGMTVCALASFLLAESLFASAPSFAYYMLPTRAGELMVGALAALMLLANWQMPRHLSVILSVVGMALVVTSIALLREDSVFPGWRAMPPTIGTALLILAGSYTQHWPTRYLQFKPLVWVGLVSYSAYLWHWPLLALYRYGHTSIDLAAGASLFVATLILAYLSYRFVEQPARSTDAPAYQVFLYQFVIPVGVLGAACVFSMKIDGYGLRWFTGDYKSKLEAIRELNRPAVLYDYVCQQPRLQQSDIENTRCVVGANTEEAPIAVLWGDSNAAHYVGMIGAFARAQNFRVRNIAAGSCPPIFTDPTEFVAVSRVADCRASAELVRSALQNYPVVMISASWNGYQNKSERFLEVFFTTVDELTRQGKLVIIIGKVPIIEGYDRLCREKALSYPFLSCPLVTAMPGGDIQRMNAKLAEFALKTLNVEYFDPTPYVCPSGVCSAYTANAEPFYYDSSHLTLTASWQVGRNILDQLGMPAPFARTKNWPLKK